MKAGVHVIHQATQFTPDGRKACLALGMFDGVHIGHQQVLRQTVSDAQASGAVPVAVTFDQHPNAVVAPDRNPPLIYCLPQRLRAIHSTGIETVLLLHFDRAFSQQPGDAFARSLLRDFGGVVSICVGRGFTFGYQRTGNVALLRDLGRQSHFQVHDIPAVACRGQVVSSTRIREAIQTGKLDLVSEMLGRPYAIAGPVIRGEQLGRQLGFPTANLDVSGLALPPAGVYAGQARAQGQTFRAVANIGVRPTLNLADSALRLEVHLLRFDGNLYGQELEFTFGRQLRGEQKFGSLEALREQIARDVAAAQGLDN